ncbi:hypothetical protein BGZ61DRAFT_474848 [Ilyonectria robusta]|uniref:uncharacterized protein n=1 Tax=Ilyonectria robusta TaxID=1079257 RepID=UPI001E8E8F34|nr:uncharacterized protein BGZ61DRAFT_474848 [Ilyonectria robusta]KAH8729184.1 hypothetical protein BGZ61DRAFT_474848 [Ilyonectria robusta]
MRQLIAGFFAMDSQFHRPDHATRHELFKPTYPGWSLDPSLCEWVQSGTVWPPLVCHPESANHLQIHPLSFLAFRRSLKRPEDIQVIENDLWRRLVYSQKPSLRWAEPITYQNKPGGPLSLRDQNRQLKEMRMGLRTERNMLGEGRQPRKREGVQQTGGNASCVAKQPKKASVQRTDGNASSMVKQPKKKGRVQRTGGIASAEAKDRSPPNGAEGRNMFTGAVGIADGDQRQRVPFDPVRDTIALNATLFR